MTSLYSECDVRCGSKVLKAPRLLIGYLLVVEMKILGIVGSPRRKSHTAVLMNEALRGAASISGVETDVIDIAAMNIQPCFGHSDPRTGEDLCVVGCRIKDDMQKVYPKLLEADGIIVGSPVYFGCIPGKLKNLLDRCSAIKFRKYRLADKVGGAFAVAAHAHGGIETTIESINIFFLLNGMIVVNDGAPYREIIEEFKDIKGPRSRYSMVYDMAHFPGGHADTYHGEIERDASAMLMTRELGKRVARVAKWIRMGQEKFPAPKYGI
jgi:multimeric flavodoxin WrbA